MTTSHQEVKQMTEHTAAQVDLVGLIPEWLREADAFDEQARVYQGKATALRQMVESVQILNGDAERLLAFAPTQTSLDGEDHTLSVPTLKRTNRFDPKDGPRGRDAVRLIVAERPGIWSLREIAKASKLKGWPSSRAALATAVQRLAESGEADWVRKGVYRFHGIELEASAPVTGDAS